MAKYVKTEDGYQEIEVINSNKMDKDNPVGTGSFSMGRKPGTIIGPSSHAEGNNTTAIGPSSHAEGNYTTASGYSSHAEGNYTESNGSSSHAEGNYTTASGSSSHAEGDNTIANGSSSHAEGNYTTASGYSSHAEGSNTRAASINQHVQGKFNIVDDKGTYAHIVGNGSGTSRRSNTHTLDWSGNAWFAGDVYTGSTSGTDKDAGSKKLATEEFVAKLAEEMPNKLPNPNALTFTGAVTGSYDGSAPLSVEIPVVDGTLTQSGKAADAAVVGNAIRSLSEEIVTTSESKVAAHNTGTDTHSDIRMLIQGLTDRINALADSDDTTLDQLSEVVAYIKSNRSLIEAITTSKVSVADIVDDLTTNIANKPLSAAQGVALKALIDAITVPDKLPNPNALTFTGAVTGSYDGSAPLSVEIPQGGGGGASVEKQWRLLNTVTLTEPVSAIEILTDSDGNPFEISEFAVYAPLGVVASENSQLFIGVIEPGAKFDDTNQTYTWQKISSTANSFVGTNRKSILIKSDWVGGRYTVCTSGTYDVDNVSLTVGTVRFSRDSMKYIGGVKIYAQYSSLTFNDGTFYLYGR